MRRTEYRFVLFGRVMGPWHDTYADAVKEARLSGDAYWDEMRQRHFLSPGAKIERREVR